MTVNTLRKLISAMDDDTDVYVIQDDTRRNIARVCLSGVVELEAGAAVEVVVLDDE